MDVVSFIANMAQIIGLLIAVPALIFQLRSFTSNQVAVSTAASEWHTARSIETNEIIEEKFVVKCTNNGLVATAIESARIEIYNSPSAKAQDLSDVISAEKNVQLSMPIPIDAAETIQIVFILNSGQSKSVRNANAFYVQRLLREKRETRQRVEISSAGLRFVDRGKRL